MGLKLGHSYWGRKAGWVLFCSFFFYACTPCILAITSFYCN